MFRAVVYIDIFQTGAENRVKFASQSVKSAGTAHAILDWMQNEIPNQTGGHIEFSIQLEGRTVWCLETED